MEICINSIESLYETSDPSGFYGDMDKCSLPRGVILAGKVIVGAACEVIKCLSIYYLSNVTYGYALTGLYLCKAGIYVADSHASANSTRASFNVLGGFNPENLQYSDILAFSEQVPAASKDILTIANKILEQLSPIELDIGDTKKFERLSHLTSKLGQNNWYKNLFTYCGKILSFITGVYAGVSVAVSGQKSASSFYSTLISGGIDSFVEVGTSSIEKNPAIHKYATLGEMTYLCEYFSERLPGVVQIP